jgi:hypothetical protein
VANWKKVKAYAIVWGFQENKGKIRFSLEDGEEEDIAVDSTSELAAVSELLRNEDEAFFDTEGKFLRTGWEIPGSKL